MIDRLRRSLRTLLTLDEPAEHVARDFGLGLVVGFSPFLGLQTLIAIAVLCVIRLNRTAFLTGSFVNLWTMFPVAALGTGLGMILTGSAAEVPELSRQAIVSGEIWRALTADIWHLLVPFFLGNAVVAVTVGGIGYFFAVRILRRYRSHRAGGTVPSISND